MYSDLITNAFKTRFNDAPKIIVRAPGRINLIGEHTDYNGGYVLPAAIDNAVYFAVSPREDEECHLIAHDLNEVFTINLKELVKTDLYSWANYLMGVLDEIQKELSANSPQLTALKGINLIFGGDIPSGGGVSSSAAIENGIGFAVNELFNLGLSRLDLLKISQRAENNFVGMKCGIMDMFASMMGKENAVIRLDCNSLEYEYFPFNAPDYRLVLCNTMVKHSLVDSEYNTRRAECEEGVALFQQYDPSVKTLRDVKFDVLQQHKNELRPIVFKRCKYVIEEISRVEEACKALKNNDLATFGKLMFQTHDGLQNEYEVSCQELDFLVKQARQFNAERTPPTPESSLRGTKQPNPKSNGVLGARMMGGGFGGCTINLVKTNVIEAFIHDIKTAYKTAFDIDLPCHVVTPKNGVEVIEN